MMSKIHITSQARMVQHIKCDLSIYDGKLKVDEETTQAMAWISFPDLWPTFFVKESLFSLVSARRAPTQDAKKDSGDQEGALTVGEHVQQKDKENGGDDTTDTSEVVTTVQQQQQEQHLTGLENTNEESNLQDDVQQQLIDVEKDSNRSDLQEVVQKHLDVVNNVNNLLDSETNGIYGDKGKDAYP
ncbi:hypothetical protein MTR67_031538 [Solanum verrucosum]|uniref:DUF4283 domain-containing protein n=1 Tax=Solanum verrucosum TaxID=315347 RepID=A0AAF0U2N6_SOLVR|nr:hypothetical protein MTR67_031538 [Solanum verrucosum]